jgi:hypothetical protein
MRRVLLFVVLTFMAGITRANEVVEYFTDSIVQKEGEYIKLLGGSSWVLTSPSLAMAIDDVVIVFKNIPTSNNKKLKVPIFYHDGEQIVAEHIKGSYVKESGVLVTVVNQYGEGAKLKLDDGSILSISEYDRYDTGWWLPPYPALITANGLYMWNLTKGKRVWVVGVQ